MGSVGVVGLSVDADHQGDRCYLQLPKMVSLNRGMLPPSWMRMLKWTKIHRSVCWCSIFDLEFWPRLLEQYSYSWNYQNFERVLMAKLPFSQLSFCVDRNPSYLTSLRSDPSIDGLVPQVRATTITFSFDTLSIWLPSLLLFLILSFTSFKLHPAPLISILTSH